MRVEMIERREEYNYKDAFKLLRVRLRHEKFDGTMSQEIERVVFERGNSVGVLLYDADEQTVLLTKQFRCPAYLHDGPGWLTEIVAGVQENGREMITVAQSELIEEIGYQVDHLEFLCHFYLSPGGSSERMNLYLGYLHHATRVSEGGGSPAEHEDIQLVQVPLSEALEMIRRGEICDAKTIIALQQVSLAQLP
ncbi:NUDIX domain-containing protein [candidate division KSB3 bacterium]|uniref:NUDIX domain-containing protein n=1 Tax=candidate division KSB3 bacterium TaxID=2044937 RepID=A0A9D5JVJ2_9BACT|nr:NUDIX domain-containing protein [candidate division KSB3 bacterium]MBD3324935.1 NUDIX domain-containing protein [candidate division KSB3 bacterium]